MHEAKEQMGVSLLPVAGIESPLVIVADAAAVGGHAPGWWAVLEAAGIEYRVRLTAVGPGGVAAIVAEARSTGARTIAAAGGDEAIAVGRAAAAAASLPFVHFPTRETEAAG